MVFSQNDKQSRFVIIGLIGGVGSGKSTLARWICENFSVACIDGDQLGHAALKQTDVVRKLVKKFGIEILDSTGQVNRSALGKLVWGDSGQKVQAREYLEEIVHPVIRQSIQNAIEQARQSNLQGVIVDAAVMVEAGWHHVCDRIVFIDTPDNIRLDHVVSTRNWTPQQWEQREQSQLSLDSKRKLADFIIDNSGTTEQSGQQLTTWLQEQFDWSKRQ